MYENDGPVTRMKKMPSFSEYFDANIEEIKEAVSQLQESIKNTSILPEEISKQLLDIVETVVYDIAEKNYTDYISYQYDNLHD